jgi:hypothetical protein
MRKVDTNNSKTDLGTQLSNNRIRIQPKTSESYRTTTQALTEKRTKFHTYRSKEEGNYRVVLKNMHYSINPEEIKAEI